ncbi:MAG TPA: HepT-like ribonuclease domain-containing protein [Xanthobacteraceae bacterium]|nr:HepT-like ribonuclease domain-containing protein [Xanthobacteraceae bacterium]
MPSEAEQAVLRDILHHLDLVQQFTQGLDYEAFCVDTLRVYAVTRCLEIISEASRRLSVDLKARHPAIGWKEMAGAGNVYRHDYEDVATRRVWDTVQLALPPLREAILAEVSGLPPENA